MNESESSKVGRAAYLRCKLFLDAVMKSPTLTPRQKDALRGQALRGDLEGARRGYERLANIRKGQEAEA